MFFLVWKAYTAKSKYKPKTIEIIGIASTRANTIKKFVNKKGLNSGCLAILSINLLPRTPKPTAEPIAPRPIKSPAPM